MDKINVKRTLKLVDKKEVKLSNQRKQKTKSSKHKNKAQYKTKQSKPRTNKTKPKKWNETTIYSYSQAKSKLTNGIKVRRENPSLFTKFSIFEEI